MGAGDVADVVEVEAEHGAEPGVADRVLRALQAVVEQALIVDAALPVLGLRAPGRGGPRTIVFHGLSLPTNLSAADTRRPAAVTSAILPHLNATCASKRNEPRQYCIGRPANPARTAPRPLSGALLGSLRAQRAPGGTEFREDSKMDRPPLAGLLPPEMTELRWRPLMTFFLDIKKPYVVGKTPVADRRIAELPGGYFEGERLNGKILASGSDWQIGARRFRRDDQRAHASRNRRRRADRHDLSAAFATGRRRSSMPSAAASRSIRIPTTCGCRRSSRRPPRNMAG